MARLRYLDRVHKMVAYMFKEIKSHRGGRQDAQIVGKYIIASKSMKRKHNLSR